MFGLQILDITIGLIFVYLLLALICTAASELFAGLFDRRARNLLIGIRHLLEEETVRLKDPKDPSDPKGKGLVRICIFPSCNHLVYYSHRIQTWILPASSVISAVLSSMLTRDRSRTIIGVVPGLYDLLGRAGR